MATLHVGGGFESRQKDGVVTLHASQSYQLIFYRDLKEASEKPTKNKTRILAVVSTLAELIHEDGDGRSLSAEEVKGVDHKGRC
ncbi:unnamed protein product [Cyprideis torosa]|uniref:Uncharacterized protein n=1 Tax=Cyprideis torosa TaxID=163714 RepID=A0A7R8ZKV7_9CRUS|nr:unnamed protein product [Cyprideis torosa]CAG0890309.1 unnamed protein product [Cyprideis torosa]